MLKSGDRVFIPAVIEAEHKGRTKPIYSVLALGDVPADSIIPDVPNLAHIARFLAEHPETVDALEGLGNWMTQDKSWPALYGLIAAMRGEGGHE